MKVSFKFNKKNPQDICLFLFVSTPAPSNLYRINNQKKNHKMKNPKLPTSLKYVFHPNVFSTSILAVFLMASFLMMGHIEAKPVVTDIQLPCTLTGPSLVLSTISPTLGTLYCRTRNWMGRTYHQIRQN